MRLLLASVLLVSLALACGGGDKEAQDYETLPPMPPPAEPQQPVTPAPEPAPMVTPEPVQPEPAMEGRFVLQVAAWRSEPKAENMANMLRNNQYDAYVERADLPQGIYYRVRIGPFVTKTEATAMGELLKGSLVVDFWIDNYKRSG
jgi:DedD protein